MKILCLLFFKRYTWRTFIMKDADDEQRNFAAKLENLDKDKKQFKYTFFKIT